MADYIYRGTKHDLDEPWPELELQYPNCGTYAGFQAHTRHKEEPCDPCTVAYAAYQKAYRDARKAKAA